MHVLLIAVAGAAGVLARHGLGVAIASLWTIAAINIAGCFLLGLLVTAGGGLSPEVRNALGIGFLGGFTTFSTFGVQAVAEADGGRGATALFYVLVSVVGGLLAARAGWAVGQSLA